MDLLAYTQIDDLEKIAKDNEVEVPRLRGYRLMRDEAPVSSEEILEMVNYYTIRLCENLCVSDPFWDANSNTAEFSTRTDRLLKRYLIKTKDEDGFKTYTGIRWDRIHGKKRKVLKFEIKKLKRDIQKQFEMWNKYVGNENVLYIHARLGGNNWSYFECDELRKKPWFLDKVDDSFDGTYCDIYAQIK